eukprot:gene175-96_t
MRTDVYVWVISMSRLHVMVVLCTRCVKDMSGSEVESADMSQDPIEVGSNGYEPNVPSDGGDVIDYAHEYVFVPADTARLRSAGFAWVPEAVEALRAQVVDMSEVMTDLNGKVIRSQEEVVSLSDSLVEFTHKVDILSKEVATGEAVQAELRLELQNVTGMSEQSVKSANAKSVSLNAQMASMSSELALRDRRIQDLVEDVRKANEQHDLTKEELTSRLRTYREEKSAAEDKASILMSQMSNLSSRQVDPESLASTGEGVQMVREVMKGLSNLVSLVDDKSQSTTKSNDIKGAEIREMTMMESLDAVRVPACRRLMSVKSWFDDQRSKVRAMYPSNQVGDEFWSWVWARATEMHSEYLDMSTTEQVGYVFTSHTPKKYVAICERLFPVVHAGVDVTVRRRCAEWRVTSKEIETCAGVMFLSLLQSFEGLEEECLSLSAVMSVPAGPYTPDKLSSSLREWSRQFEVCRKFVRVVPDWGVLTKQLERATTCLDSTSSAFAYQRNKYVDTHDLMSLRTASEVKFQAFLSYVLSSVKLFGPKQVTSGPADVGVSARRADVDAQTVCVKLCPFFLKGECQRGNYCTMYHDKDTEKHGPMCFTCGGREGAVVGFHKSAACPVRRAGKGKGKGKGKGDKVTGRVAEIEDVTDDKDKQVFGQGPEWTLDSGADHVLRCPEVTDTERLFRDVNVSGFGQSKSCAVKDDRLEVVIPGPELMSWGRSVMLGGWDSWWIPETGPCLTHLTASQKQFRVELSKSEGVIKPNVRDFIPYLCDDDAWLIRSSLFEAQDQHVSVCRLAVCDEGHMSEGFESAEVHACPAKVRRARRGPDVPFFDDHVLTHFPARKDCAVCQQAKRKSRPYVRGSASKCHGNVPLLTFDWLQPTKVASNGCRYVGVVGWVQKKCAFPVCTKKKEGMSVEVLHSARAAWGLLGRSFVIHTDNEGVLKCGEMSEYLTNKSGHWHGERQAGVPHVKNTNAYAEFFVRRVNEGVRCLMFQSALPLSMWPRAVASFAVEDARRAGISPQFNRCQPVPFGCLGRAVLPAGVLIKDKFDSRVTHVANLGVDHTSSGGVHVLYASAGNVLRTATVMSRDVVWQPDVFAFERSVRQLREVDRVLPELFDACVNPVKEYSVECSICRKWRFTSKVVHDRYQGDRQFRCSYVHVSCDTVEDPRVWAEYEGWEVADPEESGPIVIVDDDEVGDVPEAPSPEGVVARSALARHPVGKALCLGGNVDVRSTVSTDVGESDVSSWECESDMSDPVVGRNVSVDEQQQFSEALVSQFAGRLSQEELSDLQKTGVRECKDEIGRVRAYVTVVRNRDAFSHTSDEFGAWCEALEKELGSCEGDSLDSPVLRLVPISEVTCQDEVIPSMVICTIKHDGRKKCRLVACGNRQKVQASDAYAGVCAHDVWMQVMLMSLGLGHSTFLRPPKEAQKPSGHIWQVLKSIYGLKTAPRAWKATLCRWLKEFGCRPARYDDSVWVHEPSNVVVLLYVDDLVVCGPEESCLKLLTCLRERFVCTAWVSLSDATSDDPLVFLGHALWLSRGRLMVSQEAYVLSLLARFGLTECSGLTTLVSDEFESVWLREGPLASAEEHSWYRSVLGGVSYLALGSRPDLTSAVGVLSEGQSGPSVRHVASAKKLLRYVRRTAGRRLALPVPDVSSRSVSFRVEFDANFGHSKARSGICMFLGDALCQWSSRRQKCIVLSTAEAELVASSAAAKELQGAFNFLSDIFPEVTLKRSMAGDNVAANLLSSAQASLRKVRHLSLAHLYVREIASDVPIVYVPTTLNRGDVFTKVLGRQKVAPHLPRLCLEDV